MKNPYKVKPRKMAAFFLYYAYQRQHMVNVGKLQALIFYAQAWNLAMYLEPLFEEPIYANQEGPALKSIDQFFGKFGDNPIVELPDKPELHSDIDLHLQDVYQMYGKLTPAVLMDMTTQETPWQEVWEENGKDWIHAIKEETMKVYYQARLNNESPGPI